MHPLDPQSAPGRHASGSTPQAAPRSPRIRIGSRPLRFDELTDIAEGAPARLDPAVLQLLTRSFEKARQISERMPVYGRSTGVGANRSSVVDGEDADHGMRLLRSHAADAGPSVPPGAVRLMMAIRLSQLARGGSGIDPEIVSGLDRMLRSDALPDLRVLGSIGTADLTALAGTALAMMGERPTSHEFRRVSRFGPESALPFMSSSALTLSRAAIALHRLQNLEQSARAVAALSATAVRANRQAFSEAAARASGAAHAEAVAQSIRDLVNPDLPPARVQDSFGIRAYVPAHAALSSAVHQLKDTIERLSSIAQENPLFDVDEMTAVHHGGFHQVALGLALDGLNLSLCRVTPLAISRISMLHHPAYSGGRPFLARGPVGSSGHMMLEYVAASAAAEMRNAAQPASLNTVVLSQGTEEDASFAPQAVSQLERAVESYRPIVAVELLSARRALDGRSGELGDALTGVVRLIDAAVPRVDEDHDLRPEVEAAQQLLDMIPGEIARATR